MGGLMKIICINGSPTAGKDTFVKFCGSQKDGIFNISMVDGIKDIASLIGWTGSKEPKDRKFLSDLKDLVAEYNDYPFQDVLNGISFAEWYHWDNKLTDELICFIHAREPEDIQRWKNEYGARTLLIRREEVEKTYGNHSDDQVFNIDYDYVIINDGKLEDLKEKANSFIINIRKEKWSSNIWK